MMIFSFFRAAWLIAIKDIRVMLQQPATLVVTFLPPLAFLLVGALGAAAVGHSPVALVTLDHGSKGIQMQHIFHQADVFRIQDVNPQQAQDLYKQIQVVAIITIPADFTQRVNAHDPSPVDVQVNNLNLDFTNDIRRSVPDAITQFYTAQGSASPIQVSVHEQDLRSRDIAFFEYSVLPTIIFLLTISGLLNGSITTAREWDTRTIKELLLSPVSRVAIIAGKVLAGFMVTFTLGLLILLIGYAAGWTRPEGIYWLTALLTMALVAFLSSGIGIAVGAALQKIQSVIGVSVNLALYLFFLAGGTGVLAFEPDWLQNIAAFIPLTYGRHALEMAIFYSSSNQFGLDIAILAITALVTIGLGTLSMRRGIAS